jgi:hypothetical protein
VTIVTPKDWNRGAELPQCLPNATALTITHSSCRLNLGPHDYSTVAEAVPQTVLASTGVFTTVLAKHSKNFSLQDSYAQLAVPSRRPSTKSVVS